MGLGLRDLVQLHRSRPAGMLRLSLANATVTLHADGHRGLVSAAHHGLVSDAAGRVLVNVILNRAAPLAAVRAALLSGGAIIAAEDAFQPDTLSAFVPLDSVADLATAPGIGALTLSRRPHRNVGAVTSQGVPLIHSDQTNASGITGQGITIGILSDSFDVVAAGPHAADDVASNDLPNAGVPDGRPGLKFLSEGSGESNGDADEGRALAQVISDVAPSASLCFASVDFGITAFAKSVRRLRTDSSCAADILVDDIQYLDEPMFSDGAIARAIDDVVSSSTLAGRKVAYFSSAGNSGGAGYQANLRLVADADARAQLNAGVDLSSIPARIDTSGGFHNFNPGPGVPSLYQSVLLTGSETTSIVLQWDDPFDAIPGGITTDFNLLVFNSRGRFLGDFSDDNFTTNEPLELGDLGSGNYRFVIARTGRGSHLASRIRYVAFPPADGGILADYVDPQQPTLYGHAAARGAQTVGAYAFDNGTVPGRFTPSLESYSSAGPVTIAFAPDGTRLATPEIRRKPDISAPDCVNTTFFFTANPNDPFFTFCGTSAAAPHAAAAAALLLEAAGGPGSLSNERIRAKLQGSPAARDLDPFFSQAVLSSGSAVVTLAAAGDESNASASTPNFFRLGFQTSTPGQTLTGITIDLGPTGLVFDPSQTGLPFTPGLASPTVSGTASLSAGNTVLAVSLIGFVSSNFLNFGIDRDLASTQTGGNSADLLAGAKVTATFSTGTPATGVFANTTGTGYTANDGFGLLNVPAAIRVP